jgi:murein DD-endopeptidase MepM/ murein hydrolase activator NlpD
MDHALNFSAALDNRYIALQGVHAMVKPGLYPLTLKGSLPDGSSFVYSQEVLVIAGDFLYDLPLSVDPATLDPKTTGPEDNNWYKLASQVSANKLWESVFSLPVEPAFADCYASRFGSRRSYNGSDYIYFHTGLDYCGQIGDPIYAAATGVVVFAGPLTVRGNATMIDHGWGVYTAYMHQSEILVSVGDHVEQGQIIGRVGNTGRVEGPHLHFEVLVGDVQVDPLEWLNQVFP